MKKFLTNLFVYASVLILLVLAINAAYIYRIASVDEGPMGIRKYDGTFDSVFNDVPDNIQICNFGSSHGQCDFNYEDFDGKYTCFNFGMSGQTLLYDFRILQNFSGKFKKGATVFILLSHFSFFGPSEENDPVFLPTNRRYYKFLPPKFISHYDKKTDFYVNYMPALITDNIAELLKTMFFQPDDLWNQTTNREKALKHAYPRCEHFITNRKDRNGRRLYKQDAIDALYGMIEFCRKIGVTPILITTPNLREYDDAVRKNDPDFFNDFYSFIDEVVRKTGVKYYDYYSDERYINDYSLFRDNDHFNRKGARIFTDNLIRDVLGIDITAD